VRAAWHALAALAGVLVGYSLIAGVAEFVDDRWLLVVIALVFSAASVWVATRWPLAMAGSIGLGLSVLVLAFLHLLLSDS
jgi:hypothetical protein